jgi:hypothetical protein
LGNSRCKYVCDHAFFDAIDSKPQAYILSVAAADGCVSENSPEFCLSSRN